LYATIVLLFFHPFFAMITDMTDTKQVLFPIPKRFSLKGGTWSMPQEGFVVLEGDPTETRPAHGALARGLGRGWSILPVTLKKSPLRFRISNAHMDPESYRLTIDPSGITALAPDRPGLFYAAITFLQLLRHHGQCLPCCEIEDAPDFPIRGVMLDISRDKVPTMETLYWLADHLSALKVNHLQLYVEHVFAYTNHREVWQDASPLTGEQVKALDAYCRDRCIDLVPNQNSFGHLERWLAHERYLPLAELPQGGAPLPWGGFQEKPSSLCPTDPRTFSFLAELYDEDLPNFSAPLFNVGCDEPFDLRGAGHSQEHIRQLGEGRVYLDYILRLHQMVTERGKRMAFWGDIVINHPELVPEIPKDALVLEWGYEADHPFDTHGERFAASGVPFCVCPGTSSWNSLGGRTDNMLANIRSAAENGRKHGASGLIVCDWGDGGHWQPLGLSLPAFTYSAGLSWNVTSIDRFDLAVVADQHWTEGYGGLLLEIGEVYRLSGVLRANSTELFHIFSKPMTRPLLAGVTPKTLNAVLARLSVLESSSLRGSGILAQEIVHIFTMLRAACHRGIALLTGSLQEPETRQRLSRELDQVIASLRHVWQLRNRQGGLTKSIARLDPVKREYQAG
jgi:hexosaminidase